jgi:serine/threonine protein kinase
VPDAQAVPPPQRFGSFRVVSLLASGPLTEVYRCVQDTLHREATVKSLKRSLSTSSPFALSLSREARLLSSLRHDNIPRVLEFVDKPDEMWFAMELVDGVTLAQLLERSPRLDPTVATAVALEVARALAHAHDRNVVHCDVRPSNILLAKDGHTALVDFGSAQAEYLPSAPEPVEAHASIDAPTYMSPELILGEQVDPRSDVFVLGIVLYEMLAGKRPFEAHGDHTLAHAIRHDDPPPVDTLNSAVPRSLAKIVASCLQKLPADRFSSAHELVDRLESVYDKLTAQPRSHVTALALARAKLIDRPPPIDKDHDDYLAGPASRPSILPVLRMHLLMLALVVGGGAAIHLGLETNAESGVVSGREPLELVPANPGSLRVVADPWAYVIVDGQQVETTPFANPIPLAAGVHHVTLRHPNAPDERRIVKIAPGEHVLLDVTMRVKAPPRASASAPPPAPSSSTP